MNIIDVEWGSEEWFSIRRGRVTASTLGCVLSKPTTKKYRGYLVHLALDLLGDKGWPDDAPWNERGKELEPRARGAYEWKYGVEMRHDVLCVHADLDWLACTPDGLLSDRGVEIKGRHTLKTYAQHSGVLRPSYKPQVQGSMLVTGFPLWEYVNYYEDADERVRKLHVEPVPRDEAYCEVLLEKATAFFGHVQRVAGEYGGRENRGEALRSLRAEIPRPYEALRPPEGLWLP